MKKSKWMEHLMDEKEKKKNEGKSLSEVMKIASKTYKK